MIPTYKNDLLPLIDRCRRQDRSAQNELHKILYRYVYAICFRYVGDINETKEVVQDIFLKAFTKLSQYDGAQSFRTWIRKIAVNTCIDLFRTKARELPTNDLEDGLYVMETAQPLAELDTDYLLEYISRLPTAYRITFNLYAVEGYAYAEIADMLNIQKGTVSSNIAKARIHLQKMITEHDQRARI
jgi:RNA polymerase sigma factor (sigma-70 family)